MPARRLGRQVFVDVAVDQVLHGGGGAALAPFAGGIFAAVDSFPQFLRFCARCRDGPCGIAADRVAPLAAVKAVVDEERLGAACMNTKAEALHRVSGRVSGIPHECGPVNGLHES